LYSALKKIKKENVDAINIFAKGLRPSLYLKVIKNILEKNIIFTLLGYPFWDRYKNTNLNKFINSVDKLIVTSKTIFNELRKFSDNKKIIYLPYGINTETFVPLTKKDKNLRIVCLKTPEETLLEAFEKIAKENKKLKLILDKKLSKKIGEEYRNNKQIEFVGFLDNVEKLLGSSDILVELHQNKEFLDCASPPLLMIEAMSCGMKVLSTHMPEISEVITSGKNGILIKTNDSENIYHNLKKIVKSNNLGNFARATVIKSYNIKEIIPVYEGLYR
jgi:glycosyltransferase involved in cell wall biosynthesis